MLTAWGFSRAEPTRSFGDCLRGAWCWTKRMAATAKAFMAKARRNGGHVSYGSPVISPMQRATSGHRHARRADWHAAGFTARLGY